MNQISIVHLEDEHSHAIKTKIAIGAAIFDAHNEIFPKNMLVYGDKDSRLKAEEMFNYRVFRSLYPTSTDEGIINYYEAEENLYPDIIILDLSLDTVGVDKIEPVEAFIKKILKDRTKLHSGSWLIINSAQFARAKPLIYKLHINNPPEKYKDFPKDYTQLGVYIITILRDLSEYYLRNLSEKAWYQLYHDAMNGNVSLKEYIINDEENGQIFALRNLLVGWGDILVRGYNNKILKDIVLELLEKTFKNIDYNPYNLPNSRLLNLEFLGKCWSFVKEELSKQLPYPTENVHKHLISYWSNENYLKQKEYVDWGAFNLSLELIDLHYRINMINKLRPRSGNYVRTYTRKGKTLRNKGYVLGIQSISPSITESYKTQKQLIFALIVRRTFIAVHAVLGISDQDSEIAPFLANVVVTGVYNSSSDTIKKSVVYNTRLGLQDSQLFSLCSEDRLDNNDKLNFLSEELLWHESVVRKNYLKICRTKLDDLRKTALKQNLYIAKYAEFIKEQETDYFSDFIGLEEFLNLQELKDQQVFLRSFKHQVNESFKDVDYLPLQRELDRFLRN